MRTGLAYGGGWHGAWRGAAPAARELPEGEVTDGDDDAGAGGGDDAHDGDAGADGAMAEPMTAPPNGSPLGSAPPSQDKDSPP